MNTDVETNIGKLPLWDFLDIMAMQNGFDDYDDLHAQGYRISGYENVTPEMLRAD